MSQGSLAKGEASLVKGMREDLLQDPPPADLPVDSKLNLMTGPVGPLLLAVLTPKEGGRSPEAASENPPYSKAVNGLALSGSYNLTGPFIGFETMTSSIVIMA